MAEVPQYYDLMWPTLKALKALGGSGSNSEIIDKIIELEKYPDTILEVIHKDGRVSELEYRQAWAKTFLKKAGAIDNPRKAVWSLLEKGEKLREDDIPEIAKEIEKSRRNRQENRENKSDSMNSEGDEGDSWKEQILSSLLKMNPEAFERLAQRILRESGFVRVEVLGRPNDGGIDGIGILTMNLISFPVLFQCKRYKDSVSASTVRDFRGAMQGRSDKGLIITSGTFTAEAKKEAVRDGAPPIDLIDGDKLCDLLKNLELGVKTEMVEQVTVDPHWFAAL